MTRSRTTMATFYILCNLTRLTLSYENERFVARIALVSCASSSLSRDKVVGGKKKKEKKKGKEEEEKKEVGHERTVIKRIAVISLPVALTFASVDEFNRYHFAWKRARERESERASSLGSRRQWEYLCAASQRVQIAYYSI